MPNYPIETNAPASSVPNHAIIPAVTPVEPLNTMQPMTSTSAGSSDNPFSPAARRVDASHGFALDPAVLESRLQQEREQQAMFDKIKAVQMGWCESFKAAVVQAYAPETLQLYVEQFIQLTLLLNHPSIIRPAVGSSMLTLLEFNLRKVAPKFIEAFSNKLNQHDAFVNELKIYDVNDVIYLWEALVSSMWVSNKSDDTCLVRLSAAIQHEDILMLVLQLNIHHIFNIDDYQLLNYLNPSFKDIFSNKEAFIDKLVKRYDPALRIQLVERLLNTITVSPIIGSNALHATTTWQPMLSTSPQTSYTSLSSSDPESCSESHDEKPDNIDNENILRTAIGSIQNLSKLMQSLDLNEQLFVFNIIKNRLSSLVSKTEDVHLLFDLFPSPYWIEILLHVEVKYLTLLSNKDALTGMLIRFLPEISRRADGWQEIPLISFPSSSQPIHAADDMQLVSQSFSVEAESNYLQQFIARVMRRKTGSDLYKVLMSIPSEYHMQLVDILRFSMPTCTPQELAKLINHFRYNTAFILSVFSNEELIDIVQNNGFFVVLNSVYVDNAIFLFNYLHNLMGDSISRLFTDIVTLKKVITLMGNAKLTFFAETMRHFSHLLLNIHGKHFGLIHILKILDKEERPRVINLLSDVIPRLFSADYVFHLLNDELTGEKIEFGHIYFYKADEKLGFAIKLARGGAFKSTLNFMINGELTLAVLQKLRPRILSELLNRNDIISYKSVNATRFASVLQLLPFEYYQTFIELVTGVMPYIFEDANDLIKILRIIPIEHRVHFLNIASIDVQVQGLVNIIKTRIFSDDDTRLARFITDIRGLLEPADVERLSGFLSTRTSRYLTWLKLASDYYDTIVTKASTVSTILDRLLPGMSSIQEKDLLSEPIDKFIMLVKLFVANANKKGYVLEQRGQETLHNILYNLKRSGLKKLEDVLDHFSKLLNESRYNKVALFALIHAFKAKMAPLLKPQLTIRFNYLPEASLPVWNESERALQKAQFCIDAKRCYQLILKKGDKSTVIFDSLPSNKQGNGSKLSNNEPGLFQRAVRTFNRFFEDEATSVATSSTQVEAELALTDETITTLVDNLTVPPIFINLIYLCNQCTESTKGLANFIIKEILDLPREMGVILTKHNNHSEMSTRSITIDLYAEKFIFEERYPITLVVMPGKEPEELKEDAYIKTIQTFDINGQYAGPPAVTLDLPRFILEIIEQKCMERLSQGNLSSLGASLLSALRPTVMPQPRHWSAGHRGALYAGGQGMSVYPQPSSSNDMRPGTSLATRPFR